MATYNTDFFLVKRAIDSVLNQSRQDFELIIIDDGSHNDVHAKLLKYTALHEDKITYIRHKNRGQANSITRGILNSTGKFVTILDADDEYKPNHLQACLDAIADSDLIASVTETVVDTEDDYYVPDKHNYNQLVHVDDCILFATLFGRREVFLNVTFQDKYAADAAFYERAAEIYRVKKVDLKTYVYYRNISNSICSVIKREHAAVLA